MRRFRYMVGSLAVFTLACASGQGATPSATTAPAEQSAVLTSAEIAASGMPTAYDVVDRHRRNWLRSDRTTRKAVAVYMDNQPLGGADQLRQIPANTVSRLEYLEHDVAVQRWGASVVGSVIVVTRK